jgi:ABC-2 type transport system permease protein
LWRELLDLRRNRAAFFPVVLVTILSFILPLIIIVIIPALTGRGLGDDADLLRVSGMAGISTELSPAGRVQLFLFEQFLLLFLLTPITGAMSLASHAVVGEKQARTLEPLLATPITTTELLVAKVLGAFIPTMAISAIGLMMYFGILPLAAERGVARAIVSTRTALLVGLIGPAAALVALQAAMIVSSRVNDARTAQQFSVLIILPLVGILIAQFTGALWLSVSTLAVIGVGLLAVWLLLTALSVVLFDRETILTRWT